MPTKYLHDQDSPEGVQRGVLEYFVIVCGQGFPGGRESVVGTSAGNIVFVALD